MPLLVTPFKHYRLGLPFMRRQLGHYLYGSHSHEIQVLKWVLYVTHSRNEPPFSPRGRRWALNTDPYWRLSLSWPRR